MNLNSHFRLHKFMQFRWTSFSLVLMFFVSLMTACNNGGKEKSDARSDETQTEGGANQTTRTGYKRLTMELTVSKSKSLGLLGGDAAPLTLVAASGHVLHCTDDNTSVKLDVQGLTVSVEVANSCTETQILVDQVDVSVTGFRGLVSLKQDQPKLITNEIGSWLLNGLTIMGLSRSFTNSTTINRQAGSIRAQITIDGSIECASATAIGASESAIRLDVLGTFPSSATGTSVGMVFSGVSEISGSKIASWSLNIPTTTPDGVQSYSETLSWKDGNGVDKSCAAGLTVTLTSTPPVNATPTNDCALTGTSLCQGTPANYCKLPRLASLFIPDLCQIGRCLFITSNIVQEVGPDPVITSAICLAQ